MGEEMANTLKEAAPEAEGLGYRAVIPVFTDGRKTIS